MNLAHVQTFLVVIETGNLNKAADRLNVTQSTVTARINALEHLLGQRLLTRNKSGAVVTATGAKFLKHAQILVQVWKQVRHDTSLPKGFTDVCNFGCTDVLWGGAGALMLNILREHHKSMAIKVENGNENDIRSWIANDMVDLAISYDPPYASGCTIMPLFEDILIEVSTVPRELMRWDPLYVYVDYGEDFRRWHVEKYPVDDTAVVTFSDVSFALEHIISQGGAAYVPMRLVKDALEERTLFEVDDAPRFHRVAYLSFHKNRTQKWSWLPAAIESFRERFVGSPAS
ncbi:MULTISPECIES: LysR family transcriptional regulator [Mesorhizobium]|uniref:LysR family transcriptional regulator n=1 Tax=Mesorhizobium denitrificans TaxID=2294114 RepID=A0A371X3S2_9HYPH|nr:MULTISPECIES: LysR family transcriptional regulator [Mesorhizobium]RFC63876.1 LysR family transcriptional regulator [Mesorhizobium denitrificans]